MGGIPHLRERYNVRNGAATPGPSRECDITFLVKGRPKSVQQLRDSTVAARRAQSVTVPSSRVTRECRSPRWRFPPPLHQRTPWGGGKGGGGKPREWHPSQKGVLDPPRTVRFPPPLGCRCSVSCTKCTIDQTRSSFGGVQNLSGGRVLWCVFLPPYVLHPPISQPPVQVPEFSNWISAFLKHSFCEVTSGFCKGIVPGAPPRPSPGPLRMPKNNSKETYSVPPEGHLLVKSMWSDSQVVQRYCTRGAPLPAHKAPRMPKDSS